MFSVVRVDSKKAAAFGKEAAIFVRYAADSLSVLFQLSQIVEQTSVDHG